ncbi:hypothetical protein C8J57DRAFT_259459 [Mycena rebaudengoi]|nr:hypothetical protein C8J57DRAFT_259459 [Mycena rebaudengoi]
MSDYPHTPVVQRRAQRHTSGHPYMRFQTDFRVANPPKENSNQPIDSPATHVRNEPATTESPAYIRSYGTDITNSRIATSKSTKSVSNQPVPLESLPAHARYPNSSLFQRAISIEIPNEELPDYMRSFDSDFSPPSLPSSLPLPSSSPATASIAPLFANRKVRLERVEESEEEEDEIEYSPPQRIRSPKEAQSSSPVFPDSSAPHTPPIVLTFLSNSHLDCIEEDAGDGLPPCSSSPRRSSDDFFPSQDALSSPQTSDYSPAEIVTKPEFTTTPRSSVFSQKLHDLLLSVTRERDIDIALEETLNGRSRSQSVAPEYSASETPYDPTSLPRRILAGRDSFGKRPSFDNTAFSYCSDSSACGSAHTGYDADLEHSPTSDPSWPPQHAAFDSQHSAAPTQASKRPYSTLRDQVTREPSYKKMKPISCSSSLSTARSYSNSHTPRADLARIPASIRKSFSLRFNPSSSQSDWVYVAPTAPTSPCPLAGEERDISVPSSPLSIPYAVPIIAPPIDHVARLPLSKDASAKIRIGRLLDREGKFRTAAELDEIDEGRAHGDRGVERSRWEDILGVGARLRWQIGEWFLEVLPKKAMYASVTLFNSSRSSSFTSSADSEYGNEQPDLWDQLCTSPETRFHAAYMFARYFYFLSGTRTPAGDSIPELGWKLAAWDVATACLALSVKIHRDVLEPLSPVCSWEFEEIAPHEITYNELESAQRDVLATFDYSLGDTPQPVMDELWNALPSLRQLLDYEGGWNHAQNQAWGRLLDAVLEPDVLRFPISLLTAAALAEALILTLLTKYEYDVSSHRHFVLRRPNRHPDRAKKLRQKLVDRVLREVEGVVQDIQAVLRISDDRLDGCRRWLRVVVHN